ncbi:MAG: carboxypeptidase regulatory-like domain-containing protein [Bacteroidetes bacterium]|nr:carboxypeptidase regulatory-like domain-containing protein [Bacteroidota bacterium]
MIKKLLFTLSLCMMVGSVLYAQSTIKGEVKDLNGYGIPFLQILLKQDGRVVNGAYTDDLGAYQIFGVSAGTYDITAGGTMTCLSTHTERGVYVSSSEVKFINFTINCSSTELEEVEVQYVPPVFSQDNTTSSQKLTGDEVRKTPGRSITAALSNLEGVASVDGNVAAVRGNRSDGQQTIIDGVRVRGGSGIAMQTVEGLELIQGGIPAEFGDGTSFTVITTRGVAKDFHGGAEIRGSLEGYGQMLAAASLSGPIVRGKTPQDPARMGFLISAEGNYDIDANPARGGTWVAKPETIQNIIDKPVDYRFLGNNYASFYRANELGPDAFKKVRVRQDAEEWGFLVQGKIDIMGGGKDARGRPKNNLRISLNGSYQYENWLNWFSAYRPWNANSVFNSKNNGMGERNTMRLSARINHRVKTDTAANAILKNIMYDININYTLSTLKNQDRNHKDNLFGYGYIGKFTTERNDYYQYEEMQVYNPRLGRDTIMLAPRLVNYQAAELVKFDKDGYFNDKGNYYNPDLIPYTQNFIDFIKEKTDVDINNMTGYDRWDLINFLGGTLTNETYMQYHALLNGGSNNNTLARSVGYNLYTPPGVLNSGYGKSRTEVIGAKASLSLNIQNHEVKFGFEFEKFTVRGYSVGDPSTLWGHMRRLTNDVSYFPLDLGNPYWAQGGASPVFDPSGTYIMDTLTYNVTPNLTYFDQNLRRQQGITNDKVYLDIDSYDPKDFSLDLFSNYELLNSGNNLVSYSGYDYTGKISNKKMSLDNFFSGGDLNERDKYAIGAFEPIYMSIYLQDKFSISNLLFNVGLRLDYFNANQPVLKDPFLLRDAWSVGDIRSGGKAGQTAPNAWQNFSFPDNVGADWIPYVSSADNTIHEAPQTIVAYREGNTWYNSLGQEVTNPASVLGTGGPILVQGLMPGDPSKASSDAFTNYKPQWSIMPRISFSFPVSTNSLFYAHYNIITYRPTNLQINPIAYLFIQNPRYQNYNWYISNPNLRAQQSIDYEIGFRQKVGENAALSFAAYYSEKRNQIQSYRFTGAYPATYYSFYNQDFGTVQGFVLGINMRGAKNITFRANYTLSFAKGTGSSATSNLAIIASGQPNLRTLTNLDFDQRHNISGMIDLRFDQGTNYNGPVTVRQKKGTDTKREIRWLENAGATLMVSAASGMPYSRSGILYSVLGWGERTNSQLKGTINGANMPWTFTCNLRLDKSFVFNLASKKDKNDSGKRKNKPGMLTVYLDFQNLLNIKNVISVYDYTGSATDDGYLSSALFRSQIEQGTAFNMPVTSAMNYYEMAIANPYNFSQPFRVYLGIQFYF